MFSVLFQKWQFNADVSLIQDIFKIESDGIDRIILKIYRLSVSLSAIILIYELFSIKLFFIKLLSWLGNKTVEIYSSHDYFISLIVFSLNTMLFRNLYLQIFISFILSLFFSLGLSYLIKKNKSLSKILYGT